MNEMKDSLLMCDSTEGDGKAEIVMDYVMSWSLRHATDEFKESKPILSRYCRYMLGKLLDLPIDEMLSIESVNVWKEWQYMDLCVEAIIKTNNGKRHFALLIENKYYGSLRKDQLQRYQKIFDAYYIQKSKEEDVEWIKRHKLVSCFEDKEYVDSKYAKGMVGTDFVAIPFYDLLYPKYLDKTTDQYTDSESEIFNEFWLRRW